MSAAHHLSGQLRMFVPAAELVDPEHTEHVDLGWNETASREGVWNPHETTEDLAYRKVQESQKPGSSAGAFPDTDEGPSLRESIRAEGIKTPVDLSQPSGEKQWLSNGHHRVFTAHDLNPKAEIPVRWNS